MTKLQKEYPLKNHNTFGINVKARYFLKFETIKEIQQFLKENSIINTSYLILGGGSNILFTENFDGLIIHPNIKGIEIVKDDGNFIYLNVGANEKWDDFVRWSVENNYGGIENLSLIPGTVGAAPIQNIGAYGVEVKDVIEEVEAISIGTGQLVKFSKACCHFNYRDSIFKNELKNKYIITHVGFRLSKNHKFKTDYDEIEQKLKKYSKINLSNIRKIVIEIRENKLPDPKKIGNAGSFFKNPIIESQKVETLKKTYPKIPVYPINETYTKIAAGWLIEQCGWKGKQLGNARVHKKQALVLVNDGNATGIEIVKLANEIRKSVMLKFDIDLSMEVNII